jgi:hypothetical protein
MGRSGVDQIGFGWAGPNTIALEFRGECELTLVVKLLQQANVFGSGYAFGHRVTHSGKRTPASGMASCPFASVASERGSAPDRPAQSTAERTAAIGGGRPTSLSA